MKDWNIKEDKAQNAIYLKEDNGGKGRFFRARFLQAGLVKYSFGVCLLKKETIDKFVYKFVGCPVVIDHKDVSDKNAKDLRVGVISKVEFEQFDGWYWCEGVIFDQEAIDLVNNGYNVSCQYEITQYATNDRKELHNGNEYDKEILDGAPEHLAIVKNPRYESAMIAVNAIDVNADEDFSENLEWEEDDKTAQNSTDFVAEFKNTLYTVLAEGITNRLGELIASNEERWITVHPHGDDSEDYRRLKLQDGESPKEAIDRVFKKDDKGKDKKEKSEAELKAEKKQLYQDILKAKKEGRKEDHHKMLERYREIERLLKGEEKNKKNEDKQTENKPQEKSKHFEKYNKIADEANKLEKIWRDKGEEQRKLIDNNAEYQRLEKEEEKLKDERSKLNYSTDKARWHQLSQEINDIYGLKENIRKDISSKIGIREAQEAYFNKSEELTNEKVEIIKNSSEKIAERLKDNTKTDKILKELSSLSKEEYLNYKNQEIEYRKQYDALSEKLVKYSYGTPEYDSARKEKSEMYDKYLKAKGSASKIHYDFAVKVGKILQVKNGVKLSTEVSSSKMNDVVEKLHNCFDGVVPSTVFNNATMNVRANGGRAYQQGQSIHISSNEKMGTAIHETMHHIEENSAEVLINSLSFAKYRTGEERQRSLKNLTGLSYKANEVCKPDKFFNPYCGKLYNFGGGRNQTFEKGTASEIMSMGVQRIFEDPLNFAKDDREYFNFVLMNLRGELWD